jgi:hypothetical protein
LKRSKIKINLPNKRCEATPIRGWMVGDVEGQIDKKDFNKADN